MVIAYNETTVAAEPISAGVARKRLLTDDRVKGTSVLLDRLTLAAGATMQFDLSANALAWFQVLDGEATFKALYTDRLSDVNSVVLPPRFNATLSTKNGTSLLYAEIPDVARVDPRYSTKVPLFIVTEWAREPVFASEHDARKRVSLVTSEIGSTTAIKVEMVIYPPNSISPDCHHEGADTFMYILTGRGTAWANKQPSSVRPGDLIYFPDRERHYLKAADGGEMRFLEFHVPGEFKTVWADPSKISAWLLTDRDIQGRETALDAKLRHAFRFVFPWVN